MIVIRGGNTSSTRHWMNLRRNLSRLGGSKWAGLIAGAIAIALGAGGFATTAQAQAGKGYNAEDYGFAMGPVKAAGLQAPAYAQVAGDNVVVSDIGAGGIFSVAV